MLDLEQGFLTSKTSNGASLRVSVFMNFDIIATESRGPSNRLMYCELFETFLKANKNLLWVRIDGQTQ